MHVAVAGSWRIASTGSSGKPRKPGKALANPCWRNPAGVVIVPPRKVRSAWRGFFFGPADGGGRPIMLYSGRMFWMLAGALVGVLGALLYFGQAKPALAANDRFEDYIMCTGPVAVTPKSTTDGVWILDYRSGKLLGT